MERRSASDVRLLPVMLALLLAGLAAPDGRAQAQDQSHYDGTWTVRLACGAGKTCPARLVVEDYGGTWQDLSGKAAAKRACGGKKMPVTVQSSTTSLFAFTVWGDGDSPACPTLSVLVRPLDARTLEGTFETGSHATESPEVHASHALPGSASAAGGGGSSGRPGAGAGAPRDPARTVRVERR